MEPTEEYLKWVDAFKNALLKIEPEINEGQRKMLVGHYGAPNRALSVKHLAKIAGYQGDRSGSLQYGKLARKISEAIGEPNQGDQISTIAQWRGDLKDERGHGQWVLYGEVAQALEEIGWVKGISNTLDTDMPIPLGVDRPQEIIAQTIQRERDSSVRTWVYKAAAGVCECCKQNAPFKMSGGFPYLEVHHIRHLADEGKDKVSNCVALCPNCHRELHYGTRKKELIDGLYASIQRLVRE